MREHAVADISLRAGLARLAADARYKYEARGTATRRVVLVHGFNVSEDGAIRASRDFRDSIADHSAALARETLILTWPGDWPVPLVAPGAYPLLIGNAVSSGRVFAREVRKWYSEAGGPEELIIVAHSLGCRMTLEMLLELGRLGKPPGLKVLAVVLMAAAVRSDNAGLLEGSAAVSNAMVALHSDADGVLRIAFPLGQTVAGEGWMPEAVGLRGRPNGPWLAKHAMTGLDHSQYWGDHQTAEIVCRLIRHLSPSLALRNLPLPSRTLRVKVLPTVRTAS